MTAFATKYAYVRVVRQGELLPPWYGVAWVDYARDVAVCMPVPLNAVAGAVRAAYLWVRFSLWRRADFRADMERRVRRAEEARDSAWEIGYRSGYADGAYDTQSLRRPSHCKPL